MEAFIVIGSLLLSCVVLGVTMLAGAEPEHDPVSLRSAGSKWPDVDFATRSADLSRRECEHRLAGAMAIRPQQEATLDAPRILSRRPVPQPAAEYQELSDDVLSRYRCYAEDLALLREELKQAEVAGEQTSAILSKVRSSARLIDRPVGVAFAHNRPQLPLAESASTRV